jgi:hypothetical protein
MIPKTIRASHVRLAANEIRANGIPKGREAEKFLVLVDGEGFPPKLILSVAARFATGSELGPGQFSGGQEANRHLTKNLGFKVVSIGKEGPPAFLFLTKPEFEPEGLMEESGSWSCSKDTRAGDRVFVYLAGEGIKYEWRAVSDSVNDPNWVYCCDVEFVREIDPPITIGDLREAIPAEAWRAPHSSFRGYKSIRIPDEAVPRILALIETRERSESLAWDLAIQRIKSAKSPNTYMPVAVIAALELIQEGQATAMAIPFYGFDKRFDALQATLGEGAVGKGWEPFLYLASTANIWTLRKGIREVPYDRENRPRSRAQLLKMANGVAFIEELQAGVEDPTLIPRLKAMIGETSLEPTADPILLAAAVKALKGKQGPEPPAGNKNPQLIEGTKKSYVRDPKVVRWVLDRAQGICELCLKPAPFFDAEGEPFLEVHHVVLLADKGPDTVENARGLCPNCHREIHLGLNKRELKGRLLEQRS